MNINWDLLEKATSIEKAMKYWSIEFIVRKAAMDTMGDRSCEYDVYTHAYEHVYNKITGLVNEYNIVEYLDEEDKNFTEEDAMCQIATAFALNEDENVDNGLRIQDLISKWKAIFIEFEGIIATLAYHTFKYHNDVVEQRDFHTSQMIYVWLKLKKFNRDHQLLVGFTDEELRGTVITWFDTCRLSKTPDLYEQFDNRISDSEMVDNLIAELDGSSV